MKRIFNSTASALNRTALKGQVTHNLTHNFSNIPPEVENLHKNIIGELSKINYNERVYKELGTFYNLSKYATPEFFREAINKSANLPSSIHPLLEKFAQFNKGNSHDLPDAKEIRDELNKAKKESDLISPFDLILHVLQELKSPKDTYSKIIRYYDLPKKYPDSAKYASDISHIINKMLSHNGLNSEIKPLLENEKVTGYALYSTIKMLDDFSQAIEDMQYKIEGYRKEICCGWKKIDDNFIKHRENDYVSSYLYDFIFCLCGTKYDIFKDDYNNCISISEKDFLEFLSKIAEEEICFEEDGTTNYLSSSSNHINFIAAIQKGREDIVLEYILNGLNPNLEIDGTYPLFVAAECGNIKITSILVNAGADLYKNDFCQPLRIAAIDNKLDYAKYLINELKIDPNHSYCQTNALQEVCIHNDNPDFVRFLVNAGADPNALAVNPFTANKATPLYEAIAHGNIESVKTLLSLPQIDISIKNQYGKTIFEAAVTYEEECVIGAKAPQKGILATLLEYTMIKGLNDERKYLEENGAVVSKGFAESQAPKIKAISHKPLTNDHYKHNEEGKDSACGR